MKKIRLSYRISWFFLGFFVAFAILANGCMTTTGPRNMKEMRPFLPSRDANPLIGLIVIEGEPACNIEFRDQAGRLISEWSEAGANPLEPKYNGQRKPRLYRYILEQGSYSMKVRRFYYISHPFLKRRLVELPIRTTSVRVDREVDSYDSQYTGCYWGWILRINTGEIPRQHFFGPRTNITGTGLPGYFLNMLGGRR